jgi:hypothetical protein
MVTFVCRLLCKRGAFLVRKPNMGPFVNGMWTRWAMHSSPESSVLWTAHASPVSLTRLYILSIPGVAMGKDPLFCC